MLTINAIQDAIKALAQSLNVATIFPAGLFILVQIYFVLPMTPFDVNPLEPQFFLITISAALILSYSLYAFNFPLIRLFEGYKFKERGLMRALLDNEETQYYTLLHKLDLYRLKIKQLKEQPSVDQDELYLVETELARHEYEFDRHYPYNPNSVLPTRLGNTIAAFENYSSTRYGMSSIALWPRLVPILRENNYLDFVTQEKAVFDFLLNMCVVTIILWLELVHFYILVGKPIAATIVGVLAPAIFFILYQGTVIAARQWGTTVRVAFDLYRHNLHQRLGLESRRDFKDEYVLWQRVSDFLMRHYDSAQFEGFISSSRRTKLK